MKYLRMLIVAVAVVIAGCSTVGPKTSDLDTMNKKLHYTYTQIGGIINEANKLVMTGVLIPGTELYEGVDNLIQKSKEIFDQMRAATSLAEMVKLEADALSLVASLRHILIEIAKHRGEPHAQCHSCVRSFSLSTIS